MEAWREDLILDIPYPRHQEAVADPTEKMESGGHGESEDPRTDILHL